MYNIFRNEPTDKEKKGIDMILKTLHKKYPFIIGWEFTDNNPNRYSTMVGIDIIVDVDKLSEFYQKPIISTFEDYDFMRRGYSFCSPLSLNTAFSDFNDSPCYKDYFNFRKSVNKYHKYLPQDYKFHTRMSDQNGQLIDFTGTVDIDVNAVKFVKNKE